jgi:hypothetical protein
MQILEVPKPSDDIVFGGENLEVVLIDCMSGG